MSDFMSDFIDGDVISYTPTDGRHCREGMAVVGRHPLSDFQRAIDTFWGSSGDQHILTNAELLTAELIFNVADYDEIDINSRHIAEAKWNTYATDDRQLITSQHGLQKRWFIRKGAEPSWDQQIINAREELDKALRESDSAVRNVGYRHAELSLLIDKSSREAHS